MSDAFDDFFAELDGPSLQNNVLTKMLALDSEIDEDGFDKLLDSLNDKQLEDIIDLDRLEQLEKDLTEGEKQLEERDEPLTAQKNRTHHGCSSPLAKGKTPGKRIKPSEKLYCICRQPQNNKFMICCDSCEEWFHGDCVGISTERGRQMERQGEDYTCSCCAAAREADKVETKEFVKSVEPVRDKTKSLKVATVLPTKHYSSDAKYTRFDSSYDAIVERSTTPCKVDGCHEFALKNSPFCSQKCVLRFAQDSMKSDSNRITKAELPDSIRYEERKQSQPNPLRLGVRKHIKQFLSLRSKEAPDLLVTNDEIVKIAQNIEMSLFKIYPDCGTRYKAKCKAICFNIRDPKNDNLYRHILSGSLSSEKLVKLSTEEMSMRVSVKQVQQATTVEGSNVNIMDMLGDTTAQHGSHVFDVKCRLCTGKTFKDKQPEVVKNSEQETDELIPNRLALSSKPLKDPLGLNPALWKGYITMTSLTKFATSGYHVYGPHDNLLTVLPDTLHVKGRIANNIVWAYVDRLRNSPVKELIILKFECSSSEEIQGYSNLFHYLISRTRCGVIGNITPPVRDMYLVPLSAEGAMPPQLRLLGVTNIPKRNRSNLLLGLIVINKTTSRKRPRESEEFGLSPDRDNNPSSSHDTVDHLATFPTDISMPGGFLNFKCDGDDTGMDNLESITNYETIVEQKHCRQQDHISHTVSNTAPDTLPNITSEGIQSPIELDDLPNILSDGSPNLIPDSLSSRVLDNLANMVSDELPNAAGDEGVSQHVRDINTYKQLKEYIMSDNSSFNNAIVDGKPILSPLTPLANTGTREKMISGGPANDDYHQLNIPSVKMYSPLTPPPSNLPHPSTPNKNFLSPPMVPPQTNQYPSTPPQNHMSYAPPEFLVQNTTANSMVSSFQNENRDFNNHVNPPSSGPSVNNSIPSYNVNMPVNINTNSVYSNNDINAHYAMSNSYMNSFESSQIHHQFAKPVRLSGTMERTDMPLLRSQFLNRQQQILSGHRVLLPRMNNPEYISNTKLLPLRPNDPTAVHPPPQPVANFPRNFNSGMLPYHNIPPRPGIINRPQQASTGFVSVAESRQHPVAESRQHPVVESRQQPMAVKPPSPAKQVSPKAKKSKAAAKPKKGVKQKLNNKIRNKAGNAKKNAKLFDGDSLLAQLENPTDVTKKPESTTSPSPTIATPTMARPPSLVRPHNLQTSQLRSFPVPYNTLQSSEPPLLRPHSVRHAPSPRIPSVTQSLPTPSIPRHQMLQGPNNPRIMAHPGTMGETPCMATTGIQHFNQQGPFLPHSHRIFQQPLHKQPPNSNAMLRHPPPPRLIAAPYISATNTYQRMPHPGTMLPSPSQNLAPDHVHNMFSNRISSNLGLANNEG